MSCTPVYNVHRINIQCAAWRRETSIWLQFVFHHAPGARRLRFVRKMPLLKGLSDNALLDVAGRMTDEEFEVSAMPCVGLSPTPHQWTTASLTCA